MKLKFTLTPLYFLVLFFIPNNSFSQTWLHHSNVWEYNRDYFMNNEGSVTLTIIGDTIVQNIPCKLMNINRSTGTNFNTCLYEEGEVLYEIYNWSDPIIIYDFSLEIGEIIDSPWYRYKVDSLGTMTVSGNSRRFQVVHFIAPGFHYGGQFLIIEGIGFVGNKDMNDTGHCSYFFPYEFCEANYDNPEQIDHQFRCFGNENTYLNPHSFCSINSDKEISLLPPKIFPNPTNGILTIEPSNSYLIEEIEIVNQWGQPILLEKNNFQELNTSHISGGLYFFKIKFKSGQIHTKKIIVAK